MWNLVVAWPEMPEPIHKMKFECKHCGDRFKTIRSLGGHVSKKHPGRTNRFAKSQIRRDERVNERYVHKLAKEIYHSLCQNLLDEKTYQTFRLKRTRLALYEKAA